MSNGLQLDSGFGRTDEMDTLNNSMSTVIKCHLHTLQSYAVKFFEIVLCSLTHSINQSITHSLTNCGVHFNCMLQYLYQGQFVFLCIYYSQYAATHNSSAQTLPPDIQKY
ncbi:hypothetical protein CSKR_202324 [Clonorchis sinensis]|uniref:Uncharacterized protein n=1 Tax=Clonorchis sinensis TaxID=79923 RepID=A0A8T1MTY5_CLOSI|nr:hypothetical protein CSKR_202324 [Clonorchis sinensis]